MGKADERTDDFIDVPDWQTITKAYELGYKVRGKLDTENKNQPINVTVNLKDYGDNLKHNTTTETEDSSGTV